jgi:ferredoxin-NADP reductase/predicted pyridoxine 5'-phosphate oxidase superfamily flavin-nucleotide-binding protein
MGRKVIRSFMPDQHREFFAELPFVILGSLDDAGRPWASILVGPQGFMQSPDPRLLTIAGQPLPGDPLQSNLKKGAAIGLLGIQPETRRRNRMNGRVIEVDDGSFTVAVDQSFGNCPQYIQARTARFVSRPSVANPRPELRREGAVLSAEAAGLVRTADAFFIATASPLAGEENPVEGADVNHRGGKPGFVDVQEKDGRTVLVAPDFVGNSAFATFGNLLLNPKAGLLFVDFSAGHVLMLAGEAEVIWDAPEVRAFPGAERLLSFRVNEGLFMMHALPLRWSESDPAPQIYATGTWADVARAAEDASRANIWRPFIITRVEEESTTARSFHLAPRDGEAIAPHLPGQFLPIAVDIHGEPQPLRRTYTISGNADGRGYKLTVRRNVHTDAQPSVSSWLHDDARAGTIIRALTPRGDFVLDTDSRRPILFLSAGIGATPMIAMLDHLTGGFAGRPRQPDRPIFFIHAARHGGEHVFSRHVRALAERNAMLKVHVRYSSPRPQDVPGRDYDSAGHVDRVLLQSLLPLDDYDVYLCGPPGFMQTAHELLMDLGVTEDRIHTEAFGPARRKRRGVATQENRHNIAPMAQADITFRRAGIRVSWNPAKGSLLDLAEAAGIEAPWSCRAGICGTCTTHLAEGSVAYPEEPTASCGPSEALICSAVPASGKLVLEL